MNMQERIIVLETKFIELENRIKEYESDKQWFIRGVGAILLGAIIGLVIKNGGGV
jgi:hypothetical protein